MSALPGVAETTQAVERARRLIARWSEGVPFVGTDDDAAALELLIEIARSHIVARQRKNHAGRGHAHGPRDAAPKFERPEWAADADGER